MIQPLPQTLPAAEQSGTIGIRVKNWLDALARVVSSTYVADQAPARNVEIADGQFGVHAKRLSVAGKERVTVYGAGRLVICG